MKTDPTASISGAAGTPLSYGTIQSKRNTVPRDHSNVKPKNAIADTLETSDRDAEGGRRQASMPDSKSENGPANPPSPGDRLDLIG